MTKNKIVTFIVILNILYAVPAYCGNIVTLNDNINDYPIGKYLEILEDDTNSLTINDVIKSDKFTVSATDSPNPGLTSSSIWTRFTVKNDSINENWLIEIRITTLEKVELYKLDDVGNYTIERSGYKVPINNREVPHRFFIFNLNIPKGKTCAYYLRVESQDAITLPISIISEQVLNYKDYIRQYTIGIYYGVLTVMIFYNLFIYIFLRDESYLYYFLYFASFLMVQSYSDGILYGYLWTELTGLGVRGECFFIGLTMLFGILFSKKFLNTSLYAPFFDTIIKIMVILSVIFTIMSLLVTPSIMLMIIIIFGLLTIPIILSAGALCLYRGYRPARFYMIANVLFLSGVALNLLADLSLIPMNFIATHGMQIGSGLDVTLLSIALADRINILRVEKELAEKRTSILNEQLDIYNKTLEQRVIERTEQLNESRDKLIQAEKMASLGQLVAGVAHEINTPVGIGVTAASTLLYSTKKIDTSFKNNSMTKTDFETYLNIASQSSELILQHLLRAGELVKSFKMVSADQSSSEKRRFFLISYIESIITSCRPEIKKTSHEITINCKDDVEIESYPGAISQIVINILMNSIIHGYEAGDKGNIEIDVLRSNDRVLIDFKDNGKGIPTDVLPKIFDPFFTTRRGLGGTGLGLNIVFNIVTQNLKGSISCESIEGKGTIFHINLPVEV